MTPDELREITQLIGEFSNQMRTKSTGFRRHMRSEFQSVNAQLDRIDAHLDGPGGLTRNGVLWVDGLNQWSERMDQLALKHTESLR